MNRLTLSDLAYIAERVLLDSPPVNATQVARNLGRAYSTVVKAVRRIEHAGGWYTPLTWVSCSECGEPLLSPARGTRRTAHLACHAARSARYSRDMRLRHPGYSTPFTARWRETHPREARRLRDAERARRKARWPNLPDVERRGILERAHVTDRRDYPITLEVADARGAPWSSDEDDYVLEHLADSARDVGLVLGRTLWAVRARRTVLRERARQSGIIVPRGGTKRERMEGRRHE